MERKVVEKIGRAAGLGGGIGTAVGVAISLIWQMTMLITLPIGFIVGFVVGYIVLDWRAVTMAARKAGREAIAHAVPHKDELGAFKERLWGHGAFALCWCYSAAFTISSRIGPVPDSEPMSTKESMVAFFFFGLAFLVIANLLAEGVQRNIVLYGNPLALAIYWPVRIVIGLIKVVWLTIKYIHSTPRLVAGLDAGAGALAGIYLWHTYLFPQLGAVPIYNLVLALAAIAAGAGVGWGFANLHCRLATLVHLMPAEVPVEQ